MPVVSAIFLVAALAFAVVIGPQTRPWTWGPAMLCLGVSALSGIPVFWRKDKSPADFTTLAFAALTAGWFAWRAMNSPVAELGMSDLLLLASSVASFVSARAIASTLPAERLLTWGTALLLLANLLVMGCQLAEPAYTPVFRTKAAEGAVTGFFSHYNETANYLIASSMIFAAIAWLHKQSLTARLILTLLAISALGSVWFTHSRGGILAAAFSAGLLFALAMISGKRKGAKWFAPTLIGIPIIVAGLGYFLLEGWMQAQAARQQETAIQDLLDNDCRLYFLGLALSCIGLHPISGGGSRSFSWECFQFWDDNIQGVGGSRPEFVHNELIQAATDYGLTGAGLLIILFATITIAVFLKTIFTNNSDGDESAEAWRVGAFAAFGGMLVQSCFSFVFHLLPGAVLLGVCLGMMSRSRSPGGASPKATGARILLSAVAITAALPLSYKGWQGIQVTWLLWPTHFSKAPETSTESRIDALSKALEIWPHTSFFQDRATLFQSLAGMHDNADFTSFAELAIGDYNSASGLHPFEPGFVINRANLLSQLERNNEAEQAYTLAIRLQGGMEPGFRSNYYYAVHLLRKGVTLHSSQPASALPPLLEAVDAIEEAYRVTPPWVTSTEGRTLRVSIHESLGAAMEASGDRQGAMESYDFAASLRDGSRAHYRAAVLIGKMAVEAWTGRRPAEALKLFIEARKRLTQAGDQLPAGVTPSQSVEYRNYLDRSIEFLKGAKVTPDP